MICNKCKNLTEQKTKDIRLCGKCRKITKAELVYLLLNLDPIYLSERNRHKTGRVRKLNCADIATIRAAHQADPKANSYSKLAKQYKVSKSTIFNAVKSGKV